MTVHDASALGATTPYHSVGGRAVEHVVLEEPVIDRTCRNCRESSVLLTRENRCSPVATHRQARRPRSVSEPLLRVHPNGFCVHVVLLRWGSDHVEPHL